MNILCKFQQVEYCLSNIQIENDISLIAVSAAEN